MVSRNLVQLFTEPLAALVFLLRASLRNWEGISASQPVWMNGPSGQRSESVACGPETLLARSQPTL